MQSQFVFEGTDAIPTCHAGTICELENGDFLSAWFAGTRESTPDQVIMGSRLAAGSQRWSAPETWVDVPQRAAGNPRVFTGPDGAVWLIAPINYGEWCRGGSRLFQKRSFDNGRSWTDLEMMIEEPAILGKNKPLILDDDTWLLPVEDEVYWHACFLRSGDKGQTWDLVGHEISAEGCSAIQPTVVQLSDQNLLAYMRTPHGFIAETRSFDFGQTWTGAVATDLPNNNSGIDMIRTGTGNLVLVLNRVGTEGGHRPNWGRRTPLSLLLSTDEGDSWKRELVLEDEPGEYSYPAIIQASDGMIHTFYTHKRTRMKQVVVSEEEILESKTL